MSNLSPGVYVNEIASGVRPIAGVSTSTTAFIGRFERGTVDKAIRITSWGQFEKTYGGLHLDSATSYAVNQYFLNGGSIAYIIRVVGGTGVKSSLIINDDTTTQAIELNASSEGKWGDNIYVGIGAKDANKYDLLVREYDGNTVVNEEVFLDLDRRITQPRFINKIVNPTSKIVTAVGTASKLPEATQIGSSDASLNDLLGLNKSGLSRLKNGSNGTSTAADRQAALKGQQSTRSGIYALEDITPDTFNLMCIPECSDLTALGAKDVYEVAEKFCSDHFAFLLVDPDNSDAENIYSNRFDASLGGAASKNSAAYYPRLTFPDPLNPGSTRKIGPSGMMAGQFAKTDANRGVWKAPAGTETRFSGGDPEFLLTDLQAGPLNSLGVNCLRSLPVFGNICMGARTLVGSDALGSEWKYVPVRRTALYIEASLKRGLQWALFEGNDERLWGDLRLNVNAFMQGLFRKGAFQGSSAKDAYLVKCDADTTTQADIDLGIVNILVGFAPLKPAEFIFLNIKQLTKLAT